MRSKDKRGTLISIFNGMTNRLKEKIEEIREVDTIEERNRFALNLHDGLAQDLASIIKRLELCERLFTVKPQEALKEIKGLQATTKVTLDKTRRMIFDLKGPCDRNFNLLNSLIDYITIYQKENNICVKAVIPWAVNNIPPDAAKSVFYIIKEAFINAEKHSQTKDISLSFEAKKRNLAINITDSGKGFDVDKALQHAPRDTRFGLKGMQERTNSLRGKFKVESRIGGGTAISIVIPL